MIEDVFGDPVSIGDFVAHASATRARLIVGTVVEMRDKTYKIEKYRALLGDWETKHYDRKLCEYVEDPEDQVYLTGWLGGNHDKVILEREGE